MCERLRVIALLTQLAQGELIARCHETNNFVVELLESECVHRLRRQLRDSVVTEPHLFDDESGLARFGHVDFDLLPYVVVTYTARLTSVDGIEQLPTGSA